MHALGRSVLVSLLLTALLRRDKNLPVFSLSDPQAALAIIGRKGGLPLRRCQS